MWASIRVVDCIGGDVSHVATANDTDNDSADVTLLVATWDTSPPKVRETIRS